MLRNFFSFIFLLASTAALASPLGVWHCDSKDVIARDIVVRLDLDTNEFYYRLKDSPNTPDNWKPVYHAHEVFCGYAPSHPEAVECGFQTRESSHLISKSLGCDRTYDNGTKGPLTTGSLQLEPHLQRGKLSCQVLGNRITDFVLTNCQ